MPRARTDADLRVVGGREAPRRGRGRRTHAGPARRPAARTPTRRPHRRPPPQRSRTPVLPHESLRRGIELRHRREARTRFAGWLVVHPRHRSRGRCAGHLGTAQQLHAPPRCGRDAAGRRRDRPHARCSRWPRPCTPTACRSRLHLFARSADHVAFAERLDAARTDRSCAISDCRPTETGRTLADVLADAAPDAQVYICGPGPMLDAARTTASEAGWPDAAVHFEYFRNDTEIDDSTAFTIDLARSGLTLEVPSGSTILDVLRANGVPMPSSCEQGACGTCIVGVIEGEPLHQDVYLNASEHDAGRRIATCVSRARSEPPDPRHLRATDDPALQLRPLRELLQATTAAEPPRRGRTSRFPSTSSRAGNTRAPTSRRSTRSGTFR